MTSDVITLLNSNFSKGYKIGAIIAPFCLQCHYIHEQIPPRIQSNR